MVHARQNLLREDLQFSERIGGFGRKNKKVLKKNSESLKSFLKRKYEDLKDFSGSSFEILKKTKQFGQTIEVENLVKFGHSDSISCHLEHIYVLVNGKTAFLNNIFILNSIEGRDALASLLLFENLTLKDIWLYCDMMVIELDKHDDADNYETCDNKIEGVVPIFTARNKIGTTELDLSYNVLVVRRGGLR